MKLYRYICLCGNIVYCQKDGLKMSCVRGHGANVAMKTMEMVKKAEKKIKR
jgi:hypothetical protein